MIFTEAPEGADVIDLDTARAARREAQSGPKPVARINGQFVELQREVDLRVVDELRQGNFRSGLALLLDDPDDVSAILGHGFTAEDAKTLLTNISALTLGE